MRAQLSVCLLATSACGASSPSQTDVTTDAGGETSAADAACEAFASTLCLRRFECIPLAFTQGHGFHDRFGTEAVCVERLRLACEGWQRLPGTRAGAAALEDCVEQISALDCRTSTHTLTYPAGRCSIEQGVLAVGEPCESDFQCAEGSCRVDTDGYRCQANAPSLAEPVLGDPCGAAGCGRNLVCVEEMCAAPALVDEACGEGEPPCAPYAELRCDASGICASHPTSEESCGPQTGGGEYVACSTGECVARNDFGRGSCQPYAADDEACDSYAGPVCLYPAICRDGRCTVPGD